MSVSPYFFIEVKNGNTWEPVTLYRHKENKLSVDVFPYNGMHDIFDVLQGKGEYPRFGAIKYKLPPDVTDFVKNQYADCDFPTARYFNYADLVIYLLRYPTVKTHNFETEAYEDVPNPLCSLDERIQAFLEIWDSWDWEDRISDTRIIFWFTY